MSLRDIRKSKGITQKQMAMQMAMEQTTYSRKENGKSPITDEEYNKLAKFLDSNVEELKKTTQTSAKNEYCTFNDNAIGIQIISMPKDALDMILKLVAKLEQENIDLKNKK